MNYGIKMAGQCAKLEAAGAHGNGPATYSETSCEQARRGMMCLASKP